MMSEITGRESIKIGYVLAFYQAPIGSGVYPHLLEGFHVHG